MNRFTAPGKVFFFISTIFGALAFIHFQKDNYGTCVWYLFCAAFEMHFAMKNRRAVVG